jgi:hypothetical protein
MRLEALAAGTSGSNGFNWSFSHLPTPAMIRDVLGTHDTVRPNPFYRSRFQVGDRVYESNRRSSRDESLFSCSDR